MLLSLVFWLIMAWTDAVHVRRLYGTIHLPSNTETCNESNCPLPTRSENPSITQQFRMLFTEQIGNMKNDWLRQEIYSFSRQSVGRYEIIGSQTDCDMSPNGTFSCTPQPWGFCYAFVRLGFRARPNSEVVVHRTNGSSKTFNGTGSRQIVSLGRRSPNVGVMLQCKDDDHCLETQIAVLNILYRCN